MSTTALVRPAANAAVPDILKWQDDVRNARAYHHIGKIWRIVFEASRDAEVPESFVTNAMGVCFDLYGESDMLPIAQTQDGTTLLMLGGFRRPDGTVGLPEVPDPRWKAPTPKPEEICGADKLWNPGKAPMVPQGFEKRSRGRLRQTNFLVFGPVAQILVRPEGLAEGWIIQCKTDPVTGTAMDLLVDFMTGKAHLYGGVFQISRVG